MSSNLDATRIFNEHENPKHAIEKLIEDNLLENNPTEIGKFLYENRESLNETKVGAYLSFFENFGILQEFVDCFSFENKSIVDALRIFLSSFRLPGDAQMIDRILQCFATRYMSTAGEFANVFVAIDSCYILCFANHHVKHRPL